MHKIIITVILLIGSGLAYAQDFSFGKIKKSDFEPIPTATEAEAVVLKEFGRAHIEYSPSKKGLVLYYYYHTIIRIQTKDGFDHANFSIPLYRSRADREIISNIKRCNL